MKDRKRENPNGRGGGKELGVKAIIMIYFVRRKTSIFNKRRKKEEI